MLIYKATNTSNDESYIGRTVSTLNDRKYGHFWAADRMPITYFHRAIRKYGDGEVLHREV